jgi:hypothetical protein
MVYNLLSLLIIPFLWNRIFYTFFSFPGTSGRPVMISVFREENGPPIKFYKLPKPT